MWLSSTIGFFSIVKEHDTDNLLVRARVKTHLVNLRQALPELQERRIITTPERDYRFRIIVTAGEVQKILAYLAANINYNNYKNATKKHMPSPDEQAMLFEIWRAGWELQEKLAPNKKVMRYKKNHRSFI